MILQIHPSLVRAVGDPDERQALYEELTYELGKKRGRAVRMCLYDPMAKSFPIGLLSEAESALRGRGIPTARNDLRSRPGVRRGLPLSWLLPHQRAAVEAALRAVVGCIDVPTAGGKGEIIAALCMELPIRWLVLCDDRKVLHQLGDPAPKGRIALRSGEAPGIVGDGKWERDRRVTVCSIPTLHQHWDGNGWSPQARQLLGGAQGIMYDEVHGSASERSQLVLKALSGCCWRVGFSATVGGRADSRDPAIRAQLGPIVYQVPAAELEAQGITAERRVRMIRCDQPGTLHYEGGGYQRSITLSKARNAVVAEIWRRKKTGILTFVREIDHGQYLLRIAGSLGMRAAFVHGEDNSDKREESLQRFERGDLDILISSDVFKQGADIIHAYTGITGSGGKASIGTIQRLGRGGRICRTDNCARCAQMGKKASVEWFDFYDEDSQAEAARKKRQHLPGAWLRRHAEARRRAYEEKGVRVEIIGVGEI